MTIRRIAIQAFIVLSTLTVLFLLWQFRETLILFLFSLAVAAATRPFVERLTARGMKRGRALLLVYAVFLILLLGILVIAGSSLLNELQQLSDSLARMYDRIWTEWPNGTAFQQLIVQQLPAPADVYESFSVDQQGSAMEGLLGVTLGSAAFIGQFFTVLVLSLYWGLDQVHFERLWLSLLPVESRARSRNMWRDIERDFGVYILSELLQSLIAGLLLAVGLAAMGVRYPTLLALFGALAWLIPWLGGLLVILPVALTALSQSLILGLLATLYVIGVLLFLEFYVEPRFLTRRRYSSLLSILLIIALVEPFGLMGFIVAPPLAAAIQLIFRSYLTSRQQTFSLDTVERISLLRERVSEVRALATQSDEPLAPQTMNMLQRLEQLVSRADEMLIEKSKANRVQQ